MGGGPEDGSVIPTFARHIASRLWEGPLEGENSVARGCIRCQSRGLLCAELQTLSEGMPEGVKTLIADTGLSPLPWVTTGHFDLPLISAFVERWQPDTKTFHLPFGEMTIMLHDVFMIVGIPIEGRPVSTVLDSDSIDSSLASLLQDEIVNIRVKPPGIMECGGVRWKTVMERCGGTRSPEIQARGWLLLALGSCLFVDKTSNRVTPHPLVELDDLSTVRGHSWGSACLAYLFRQLGVATRADSASIGGCLTLLQAWIYEYFPCFPPHATVKETTAGRPRALRWEFVACPANPDRLASYRYTLDYMSVVEVSWTPYGRSIAIQHPRTLYMGHLRCRGIGEIYAPNRVTRQLGYVQEIPTTLGSPGVAYRPRSSHRYEINFCNMGFMDVDWSRGGYPRLDLTRLTCLRQSGPTVAIGYLELYLKITHSKILRNPPQGQHDNYPPGLTLIMYACFY
ncbi:protein MAIN-LIKE 1-like [Spinacia oleracea]|uniref:Protein MAIN-LIKE 1-like n=1 Tax=Spinacia oleracea TaxID=3562 RepID=A0ABM3QQS8_SPIOL|nr:protein MAIN-LIKE 1-like [Spinacia oleracea]